MNQAVAAALSQAETVRRSRIVRELAIVGIGYGVYSQVRGLAGDRVVDAFHNAYQVVEFEKSLGIFEELALQQFVQPYDWLLSIINFIYFYGLFPLLIPTAIWLFVKKPDVYVLARNAFLASGAIAVIFFLLIPTAPPRLVGLGFIDTLGNLTPTYNSIPGVNHFAAVPSMHVGWNFLTALALFMAFPNFRLRWVIMLLPVAMFFSTVVTGNHYFIDGVLGLLVASAGLGVALGIRRYGERKAARAAAAPVEAEAVEVEVA